jgi:hypothetical protein
MEKRKPEKKFESKPKVAPKPVTKIMPAKLDNVPKTEPKLVIPEIPVQTEQPVRERRNPKEFKQAKKWGW